MVAGKLSVYNTLSRSTESFVPMNGKEVKMFVCGQTVYDDAHLGHAKNYINFDVISRWLRHSGYKVNYIQNITDVDDKIIARAKEKEEDPIELARRFEKRFMEDMEAIGVRKSVDDYPRSHDYIDTIREQIQLLFDNGYAYPLEGDIYFDVKKFHDYTKLSGMKLDELEKHRIEPLEGKKNAYDFALWKASKEGEPSWEIKVKQKGKEHTFNGRPGWHIEDTAITYAIFGPQYDLHGGASELIFPHHSNEIAQAEAAFGKKPFVKYWLHSGVLTIRGEKMSKSLKNFITIRELLKTHDAETLRLFVCSTHYRKEIKYSEELLKEAEKRLRYMYSSFSIFYNMKTGEGNELGETVNDAAGRFAYAMNDDFNTPLALTELVGCIDNLRNYAESHKSIEKEAKDDAVKKVLELADIFGVLKKDTYKEKLPDEAMKMVKERQKLRKDGNYKDADRIRDKLKKEFGIILEDTSYGPIWYKG